MYVCVWRGEGSWSDRLCVCLSVCESIQLCIIEGPTIPLSSEQWGGGRPCYGPLTLSEGGRVAIPPLPIYVHHCFD